MEAINRLLLNVLSDNLENSKAYYTTLFDFQVDYDSDWFVHLISPGRQLELGILSADSDMLPTGVKPQSGGFFTTFVVEDAGAVFRMARERGFTVLKEPEDTFYGQRRLVLESPEGGIIDVSSPIPDFTPGEGL
ncbi:MAG: VOC family protein [Natronospirillum sp.]|uniref:VOC family protein n=1 Tax=Natronospirillum sp. TaxID=2812955 RepID=UPI0025F798C8|nr:VOC family protein [Natronospirillum sp.]MCH8550862.1 VOC family protein [Natronospirillum sp.]